MKDNFNEKLNKKNKFNHIKMRIKESKEAKKELNHFERSINKRKYQGKFYLDFNVIKSNITNKFLEEQKKLIKLKENFKIIKNKNNYKTNKILELKKQLKNQKIKTYKEKKVLKKEIKEINILNNKPKGKVIIKNKNKNIIEVRNASKFYTSESLIFQGLKNINIEIEKGSFNVILGPSGSGKTTLLNIISGLDRATKGEVIINDINIQSLSNYQTTLFRKEKLGFVFQSYNLLSSLNVKDNIEVGRSLQNDKNKRMDISNLLKEMDMDSNIKKMIYELSGGQQQRVSIARAISKMPDILIGDEPTGALDQKTSIKVFELFQEINKNNNTTIIIVTHNPNVAKLANLIIKIKDGQIEELIRQENPINAKGLKEL